MCACTRMELNAHTRTHFTRVHTNTLTLKSQTHKHTLKHMHIFKFTRKLKHTNTSAYILTHKYTNIWAHKTKFL